MGKLEVADMRQGIRSNSCTRTMVCASVAALGGEAGVQVPNQSGRAGKPDGCPATSRRVGPGPQLACPRRSVPEKRTRIQLRALSTSNLRTTELLASQRRPLGDRQLGERCSLVQLRAKSLWSCPMCAPKAERLFDAIDYDEDLRSQKLARGRPEGSGMRVRSSQGMSAAHLAGRGSESDTTGTSLRPTCPGPPTRLRLRRMRRRRCSSESKLCDS